MEIGPSVGAQPDGTFVTNYVTQQGRVVIVGEEPLLEALRSTNSGMNLILYAAVGSTNVIETAIELPPSQWSFWREVVPTNLLHSIDPVAVTNRSLFFRAWRR